MSKTEEIFKLRKANDRIKEAKVLPNPKMLFGEFWLEGELCILFADTGKGKSILAVQIAESIARGVPIEPMKMSATAQKVVYFDFELSAKQFEMRYAAEPEDDEDFLTDHYEFSDNFYSVEIDADGECPEDFKTFEAYLRASLENMIRKIDAKVVIIDNITYLRGANDTARAAIPLMRELKRLKKELGLSILVLAHTPKRDMARPLTVNDLQGSKVLSNFADNVFAIGQSGIDSGFRYVKHIKPRSTEMIYDASNVLVGEIRKWEKNFLAFRFYKFSPESDHLKKEMDPLVRARAELVQELTEKDMSQRQIAAKLGISVGSVNRYLQMTREEEDYVDLDDEFYDDEEEETEEDWPEDPEERFKAFLKKYDIPDPRVKEGAKGGEELLDAAGDKSNDGEKVGKEVDGEDPTVRHGLEEPGPGKTAINEAKSAPIKYKSEFDKIEVGDIVMGADGQLKKRTHWGWDKSMDAVGVVCVTEA